MSDQVLPWTWIWGGPDVNLLRLWLNVPSVASSAAHELFVGDIADRREFSLRGLGVYGEEKLVKEILWCLFLVPSVQRIAVVATHGKECSLGDSLHSQAMGKIPGQRLSPIYLGWVAAETH